MVNGKFLKNYFNKTETMTIHLPPRPLDDQTITNPLECPSLRWGLIGCGRISHDFTQALKLLSSAQVIACSARSLDSAKAFAEKHGIPKACKLYKIVIITFFYTLCYICDFLVFSWCF